MGGWTLFFGNIR